MKSKILFIDANVEWSTCSDSEEVIHRISKHLETHAINSFKNIAIPISCSNGNEWCIELEQSTVSYKANNLPAIMSMGIEDHIVEGLANGLHNGRGYMTIVKVLKIHPGACT